MPRLPLLTLSATVLASTALLCTSAFAADAGTYRPGNAYHSITAASPNVCEMQCSGDAQCRSWNYIRLNEGTQGVCEFNENISSPVPSAMSISGENVSRARAAGVVRGKTNTVRVGSPSVTQAMAQPPFSQPSRTAPTPAYRPSAPQAAAHSAQMQHNRRHAQPRGQIAAAAPRYPAASPNQKPSFRHSLEDVQSAQSSRAPNEYRPQANTPAAPQTYAHADPRLQRQLQQQRRQSSPPTRSPQAPPQTYPPVSAQPAPQSYAAAPSGLSAPPGVPPLSPTPKASYMSPSMAGAPRAQTQTQTQPNSQPRRVNIPAELSPRPMGSGDSLFGSLYDDVKVPRPIDPALAADPDAPIPTVSTVPRAKFNRPPL